MADGKLPYSHSIPSSQITLVNTTASIKPTVDGYIKSSSQHIYLDLADKCSREEGLSSEETICLGNVSKSVSNGEKSFNYLWTPTAWIP